MSNKSNGLGPVAALVERVMQDRQIDSPNKLASQMQIHHMYVYRYLRSKKDWISLDHLLKLRKISGLSWGRLGKMLDEEFLSDE